VPVAQDEHAGQRRGRVAAVQRARIVAAVYEVCAQRGAARLSVGTVVARAGVSRRTFYELFDNAEACLLAALEQALAGARESALAAWRPDRPWRVRVRAALIALLAHLDEQPPAARLLLVESPAAGPRALQLRAAALAPLVAAVAAGEGERRAPLPPLTAEGAVGGVLAILYARLTAGAGPEPPPLLQLANELMALIVLPYLGPASAAAELEREPPAPRTARAAAKRGGGDPLDGLRMRVTYRTVRVLAAIAAEPGGSNRPIGRAAGIDDQGQISKLLWRLEGLGLVTNDGAGHGPGTRNAWRLTERGLQLCARVEGTCQA
jgi:AcrR family transcriptional regulator